jgi:Flp pilus assembly protein TadG
LGRRKGQRGAALVEYAFIAILFLSLLFGISGFGHALYAYQAVNHAAKEATRWAAVNGQTCPDDGSCNGSNGMNNGIAQGTDIQSYVLNNLPPSIDSAQVDVNVAWSAPAGSPLVCTQAVAGKTGGTVGPFEKYPGCTVSVQVAYAYAFIFPLLPTKSTTTAPCTHAGHCLSSTSQMVIIH